MTAWNSSSRDATKTGIVVVEMLLSMIVRVRTGQGRACSALDGRNVVGRVRALQLRRSRHALGSRGRHDAAVALVLGVLREIVEVNRAANASRSVGDANAIGSLARGSGERRQALLWAMTVNNTAPTSRRRLGIGRRRQGKV